MKLKIKKMITSENCYTLLFMVVVCRLCLFDYFRAAIYKIPLISEFSPLFFPLLFAFLIYKSGLWRKLLQVKRTSFLIVSFFTSAVFISCVFYPQNADFILNADSNGQVRIFTHILPCILYYFLGEHFEPTEKRTRSIAICSCISIAVSFAYLSYYLNSRALVGDDMAASYALLLASLVVTNQALKEKKLCYFIFAVLGMVYALMMGTRGPVVILLCFWLVGSIYYSSKRMSRRIIVLVVLISAMLILVYSPLWMMLLKWINIQLAQAGFTTRVIDSMLKGVSLENSSGRDTIYETLLALIDQRPILGYGVYGEWQFTGYSAHNIYIEAIFQYGVLVGTGMILAMMIGYAKAFNFKEK